MPNCLRPRRCRPPPPYTPQQPVYQSEAQPPRIPVTPVPPGGITEADIDYVQTHQPIMSQVGYATWYTAPYKGRKAANGEVFSDDAMTAANRTLPMGSLIVVTNLQDRAVGGHAHHRSRPVCRGQDCRSHYASAKATGVYRAGIARVRLDVYQTPKPISTGGRWCVQIGAFKSESEAIEFKAMLLESIPTPM